MRKFLSLLLIVVIAIGLVGCNVTEKKATLDDAREILEDHTFPVTDEDGVLHTWIMLYNGTTFRHENESLITELEKAFGTPSYGELLKMSAIPNKSEQITCGEISIKITSLPTNDFSQMISIQIEEVS